MAKAERASCGLHAMRAAAQVLLAAPLDHDGEEQTAELLCRLGLTPDQQSAILLQLIRKAKEGDFRSIQMVRELTEGEEGEGSAFAADLRMVPTEELERMLGDAPMGE